MKELEYICSFYVIALGIFLIIFGVVECFIPKKIFSAWKWWINHRLFPLYGLLLMIGGLPLTFFRDGISGKIMMGIGIFVVFTGPFIILFPKRMSELYSTTEEDLEEGEQNGLIYFDALTRIVSGALFLYVISNYRAVLQ
jgi:uncharacterized membrane protein